MGGSAEIVRTLEGGLARGVLGVYKAGGWVKNDQKRAYVICTQSHTWNFYIQMYVHLNAFVIMVDIFLFEERSRSFNMFYASSRD